jgi:tetratricopeptide (TPR) repeat protein
VLSGDPALLPVLGNEADAELKAMACAVAYTLGLAEVPPEPNVSNGELAAVIGMVAAAHAIEAEDTATALTYLTNAIDSSRICSPLLAAHLLNQRAQLRRENQAIASAIQDWEAALRLAVNTAMPGFIAHLHLSLGSAFHEAGQGQRAALDQAAKHYQQALLAGYNLEENPEMFAWTQQQLALAYLAMPLQAASDQLRMAIAVQSLREALKVYKKETHLEMWTTVQLNLANALQYLPSGHPRENLIQAVEIYEELLPFRERAFDPVGYARLLFNQANALAHLGIFQAALEKLNESHKLLHWHGEGKLAASALEQAARINEMMAATPVTAS